MRGGIMSENQTNITGIFKTIGSIIKLMLFLLVVVISILAGAVLVLYSMYRSEKKSATAGKTPPEG